MNIKNEEDEDEPNIDETRIMVLKLLLHPPIKWPHLLLRSFVRYGHIELSDDEDDDIKPPPTIDSTRAVPRE